MTAKPLCPRTLRNIARRMRTRANRLDKRERQRKKLGLKMSDVAIGRACECDLWADNLLAEAKRLEKAKARK